MDFIRLRPLAIAASVVVMTLSACSGAGDPADDETAASGSTDSAAPVSADDGGADAHDDSATEPAALQPDGRRVGGEMIGFTVELPEGWRNVPTDHDEIDAFADQEGIPADVATSMHRVVQDGLGEGSLLAYGGTEDGVDVFLIASCEPSDGSDDGTTGSATVDGIPAARTSNRDSDRPRVWLNYRFLAGHEACWVRFPAPDESWFDQFDDIVATIDVL